MYPICIPFVYPVFTILDIGSAPGRLFTTGVICKMPNHNDVDSSPRRRIADDHYRTDLEANATLTVIAGNGTECELASRFDSHVIIMDFIRKSKQFPVESDSWRLTV